jgi:hypothetical protein
MGLSGWLYTDLMLGLVVVFLGAVVITVPTFAQDEDGDTVIVTTTTTTTIPVDLCTSLFEPSKERDPSLLLRLRIDLSDEELVSEFKFQLANLYEVLNSRPEVAEGQFNVATTKIGFVLFQQGKRSDGDNSVDKAQDMRFRLSALLPEILGESGARYGNTASEDYGVVVMDLFPLLEIPCDSR